MDCKPLFLRHRGPQRVDDLNALLPASTTRPPTEMSECSQMGTTSDVVAFFVTLPLAGGRVGEGEEGEGPVLTLAHVTSRACSRLKTV